MRQSLPLMGYAAAAFSVVVYAMLSPLYKKFGINFSPFVAMTTNCVAIGGLSLAMIMVSSEGRKELMGLSGYTWLVLLGIGAINFVGFYAYLKSIGEIKIMEYELIAVVGPLIAGVLAFALLGEKVTLYNLLGFVIVAFGLYVGLFLGKA